MKRKNDLYDILLELNMLLTNHKLDDETLVERIRQGNHKAYETLFRRYYAPICGYAARFVDVDETEDVADDIMSWLWEKREGLFIQTTFKQYLYTMVYHRATKLAMRNRLAQSTATHMEEYRRRHELNETDFVEAEELRERIKVAIDALPETYRNAFLLHRFEGKSYKEIAEIYQLSPKTIDYRIQKALKQLRQDLGEYLPAVVLMVVMEYLSQTCMK